MAKARSDTSGDPRGPRAQDPPGGADSPGEEELAKALAHYSPKVLRIWMSRRNHGAMTHPDGRGTATSDCGDHIEVHLRAREGHVTDSSFVSEGCGATFAAGSAAAQIARGRSPQGLLGVEPEDVLAELDGLPEPNRHCADLAVRALRMAARDLLATAQEPWKRFYRQ